MEEIKRTTKEFVPPVEKPSLNGETIADICEIISLLNFKFNYEQNKRQAAELQIAADELNMLQAERIGCGDVLVRLRRNALALSNQLAITKMVLENIESNVRDNITARDAEHDRYMQYVAKLRKSWQQQMYEANKKAKKESKKAEKK